MNKIIEREDLPVVAINLLTKNRTELAIQTVHGILRYPKFAESGEPVPDPNLDDSHLAPHPIFSGPIELPPTPPPLPDLLDAHLCSTSELNDGQWLLSSAYRNEASSRISKRVQRELESPKSKPVKRVRRLYKFFDLEASDSEKESGDSSQEVDAYDLNDPFINDDEECEELSTTSSPP